MGSRRTGISEEVLKVPVFGIPMINYEDDNVTQTRVSNHPLNKEKNSRLEISKKLNQSSRCLNLNQIKLAPLLS